jgi:hypothetical protein
VVLVYAFSLYIKLMSNDYFFLPPLVGAAT